MKNQLRRRNRILPRISMRTVLVVGVLSGALFLAGIMLLVNIFKEEDSNASNPMVISGFTTSQDTASVLKGTVNQQVLRIKISTKGNNNLLNLVSMEFSARGTGRPYRNLIESARLWSSAQDAAFNPVRQVGETLGQIPEENFIINIGKPLISGDNYFFLTFDIRDSVTASTSIIDAECIRATVGTLAYDPDISAPPGSLHLTNNHPYYSCSKGDISNLNSWNSKRDGSGNPPVSFNENGATFHIQAGYLMQNQLNACLPVIVIERNGILRSASGLNLDLLKVCAGGTYIQLSDIKPGSDPKVFWVANSGNYIHLNKGKIPGKQKRFEPASTVILNDYSQQTFTEPVSWGNLVVDAKSATIADISGSIKEIKGDFRVSATGPESYLYLSGPDSIIINGDLVIDGGRLALASTSNPIALDIKGKLIMRNGWLSDLVPSNHKGRAHLLIEKDVNLKGGTLFFMGIESTISIAGEICRWSQSSTDITISNINILPRATLVLDSDTLGPIVKGGILNVMTLGKLNAQNGIISGKGTFNLDEGGELITSNSYGINSEGEVGTIQTATRIFNSGSSFTYSGSTSPQRSGIFKTKPELSTLQNLVISKSQHANVVVMEQPLALNGKLVVEKGALNKNSFELSVLSKTASTGINRKP